jgi:hypothetical protein
VVGSNCVFIKRPIKAQRTIAINPFILIVTIQYGLNKLSLPPKNYTGNKPYFW